MQGLSSTFLAITCLLVFARRTAGVALPDSSGSYKDDAMPGFKENPEDWIYSGQMLSVPRSSIAATSVGHFALFAGGRLQNDLYTDVVDIFNKQTGKWTVSHLSSNRSSIGAGSVAGRYALFAGGLDASFRPMSVVDVYDTETGKWSTLNLHTPRSSPKILDLGTVSAIVGGLSGDLQYLSMSVDYVNANLAISNDTLQIDYPQFGVAISDSANGLGLFTSGYQNNRPGERFNDFQPSNQTTVFEATNSAVSHTAGQTFPYPRWGAGGAAVNGVFAIGGGHLFGDGLSEPLTTVVDRVDIYNAKAGEWISTPLKLSVARDYLLVQALGDYIVFVSGTDQSKEFDILDMRSLAFIANTHHKPSLYTLRYDASAVTVDNCLLIVAGGLVYQGRSTTGSVEMFDACIH
ncbi:hypothetical protein LPJ66_006990 [Kickxella alabastrina]|uniref:Uncharacterized protein n=1 Tax=Kickxella alabastrina TaxID=61397 RepID=A0ACC1IG75_9FUNG|nr:hypothetical protein LPJ66_006990 [Kickxella alabastrina]